jgi:hypothetical protein
MLANPMPVNQAIIDTDTVSEKGRTRCKENCTFAFGGVVRKGKVKHQGKNA